MTEWRKGDIVLSQRTGTVLEFLGRGFMDRPRWMQLSPLGDEVEGYDPDDPVLLARKVGDRRMAVIDFEGLQGKHDDPQCHHTAGATWQGACIDCGSVCAPNLDELAARRVQHEPDGAA